MICRFLQITEKNLKKLFSDTEWQSLIGNEQSGKKIRIFILLAFMLFVFIYVCSHNILEKIF